MKCLIILFFSGRLLVCFSSFMLTFSSLQHPSSGQITLLVFCKLWFKDLVTKWSKPHINHRTTELEGTFQPSCSNTLAMGKNTFRFIHPCLGKYLNLEGCMVFSLTSWANMNLSHSPVSHLKLINNCDHEKKILWEICTLVQMSVL